MAKKFKAAAAHLLRSAHRRLPVSDAARQRLKNAVYICAGPLIRDTASYRFWHEQRASGELVNTPATSWRASSMSPAARDSGINFEAFTDAFAKRSEHYRPLTKPHVGQSEIKVIAYYLPQFHPIAENNEWWGRGFTEWTNVSKSVPQFEGHYQPHLPGELGFYDLRLKDVQRRQIELARTYGVHAFCYHHYWFAGRRLLETPFKQVLEDPSLDLPFCLCWANENWTRRWDGAEHDILLGQHHSPEDDVAFIADIAPALRDPRYVRVDGRPLLIVYRVSLLPDAAATAARWRKYCIEAGIGDLYLVAAQTFGIRDPRPFGFDAAVEFPPHTTHVGTITDRIPKYNPTFQGNIYHYPDIVGAEKAYVAPDYKVIKCVMPAWDNSARKPGRGNAFVGSTPAIFSEIVDLACQYAVSDTSTQDKMVFVNAWNEWGEGAHLEPDRRYGYAYLEALAHTIAKHSRDRTPLVSVVLPAYNHVNYVEDALRSLEAQTYANFEIIIVDDGSSDGTADAVERFLAEHPAMRAKLIRQPNGGSHAAIAKGISLACGALVAILNSDDRFAPGRLQACVQTLIDNNADLVFSDVTFFNESDTWPPQTVKYVDRIKAKLDGSRQYPSLAFALLDSNVAISTGNFLFRKSLYTELGGFSSLKLCHDWDFLLQALARARVAHVPEPLYLYRLHDSNTFEKVADLAVEETRIVLARFFDSIDHDLFHSLFPDAAYFRQFVTHRQYWPYIAQSAPRLRISLPIEASEVA